MAKLYKTWLGSPAEDDVVRDQSQWDVLTAEPGGIDYLETDAGGTAAMWAVPKGCAEDRVLLCVHGGGFVSGSIHTHRKMFGHLAKAAGVRALIVGYPLLPEGVHPLPVDHVVAAYRWLLGQGVDARRIAFAGDSAGGGLAVTAQLRARDQGLPLPAGSLLISPWVDMEVTGGTMVSNSGKDALFNQPWVKELAANFLGGGSPRDPHANALHADLTGLGPIYAQVGDQELLLDDSRRLTEHAEKAGVSVRLDVFPEQQHTFQMMVGRAPEADDAIRRFAEWVGPLLGR
ncbi:esterase [Streptomyces albiflavescens]|uniref:Esterase n=1 Tax=Streptomyces albiflavescens TaxID=1623582 RepID=A0A917YAL4_9ACTN|nr:esterase [Streptomyces albiflavescens]